MNIYVFGSPKPHERTFDLMKAILESGHHHIKWDTFEGKKPRLLDQWLRKLRVYQEIRQADVVIFPAFTYNTKFLSTAKKLGKKVVVDYYISMYDTNVLDRKFVEQDSPRAKRYLEIDTQTLSQGDVLFFLNEGEGRHYASLTGLDYEKMNSFILPVLREYPVKANLDFFNGKREKMNLCWTGSYIPLHGLNVILEALKILVEEGVPCTLYLWGDDEKKAKPYVERINELHLEEHCVVHNQWGDLEQWIRFIQETCDVTLGIFGDSTKAKTVIANKVMDGVAFETPVITGYSVGLEKYFFQDTLLQCNNTPQALAEAIKKLYNMPKDEVRLRIDGATQVYKKHFSRDIFNRVVKSALDQVERDLKNKE